MPSLSLKHPSKLEINIIKSYVLFTVDYLPLSLLSQITTSRKTNLKSIPLIRRTHWNLKTHLHHSEPLMVGLNRLKPVSSGRVVDLTGLLFKNPFRVNLNNSHVERTRWRELFAYNFLFRWKKWRPFFYCLWSVFRILWCMLDCGVFIGLFDLHVL